MWASISGRWCNATRTPKLQRPATAEDASVSSGRPAGIGRATALAFTRATASTLSLAAQSDLDAVNAFNVEILSIAQSSVITMSLDVISDKEVCAAVKLANQHLSCIDVLIINNTVYLADFRPIGATELSLGNAW
ncbi:hypothetical protein HFD88_009014 [Aspergillus terreus]|nr:hypothetical protein HFD88_009014 [Aspergillus terreus]